MKSATKGERRPLPRAAEVAWEFHSHDDVRRFWVRVRDVPRRTGGRTQKQYERFYLALYLLALADHEALTFPFKVVEGESPDFMLTFQSGEITGLEVTRATAEALQAALTRAEREHPEGTVMWASPLGYAGDQIEREFCDIVKRTVEAKVAKLSDFRPAARHDLLIPDDTGAGAGDRRRVLSILARWACELRQREPRLGKISIVASLDVLYDVGGESRIFPYVSWSAPQSQEFSEGVGFSDRAEDAGRIAVEDAIRKRQSAGLASYFIDGRQRLVKQTSNGRRFEVRVDANGDEITIRELLSRE